jgi:hypothetical protein
MQKGLLFIWMLLLGVPLLAQRISEFSEDHKAFVTELGEYVTASKRQDAQLLFDRFKKMADKGGFTPEELEVVRKTGNAMLGHRMAANPIFNEYLRGLFLVKESMDADIRFQNWHEVLLAILGDFENRKVKDYQEFLEFSTGFFEFGALRASTSGVNWLIGPEPYRLAYEYGEPLLSFEQTSLVASRKTDSIAIFQTKGVFYPFQGIWKGQGGRVNWERFGLPPDVYVELNKYEVDVKKTIYEVEDVLLRYPAYFGQRSVKGKFEDKVIAANTAIEGSYPRFESYERVLNIENIGQGIELTSGFRLQGTTVYAVGSRENPAELRVFNDRKQLSFRGTSELFTVRREERIVSEGVEGTLYIGEDTLYHPSVNVRLEIPTRVLKLTRGSRGNDRNPFYSSYHQVTIDSDKLDYYIAGDSITIGERNLNINTRNTPVSFESAAYFDAGQYHRFQSIATYNPIAVIKSVAEREGRFLNGDYLASKIDSRFNVDNIKTLLYDLVSKGFIKYDGERNEVEVLEKIFHYAKASQGSTDFDALNMVSDLQNVKATSNGTFYLNSRKITMNGVSNVELSRKQRVGLRPVGGELVLGQNRDLDFDGKLFAGYGVFTGKDFHFRYDQFKVELDSVRYFDLFLPTGKMISENEPEAKALSSRIEHLRGELLIDAPGNKAGKDDIPMFPNFSSTEDSYVYYDAKDIQGGVYNRDSFYFRLRPFVFESLDRFARESVGFEGTMVSAGIFPDFKETLRIQQHDESLGFVSPTPKGGYPAYGGKGRYTGDLNLSNSGLLGRGVVQYLNASIEAENIAFQPTRMIGSAKEFNLEENRGSGVEVPQAYGKDVVIDWRPYRDSLYITSVEATPFDIFKAGGYNLNGRLILTPDGLKGDGNFSWSEAEMRSKLFSFGAFSIDADTTDLRIKAFEADDLALKTANLNGKVNFDKQTGIFLANDEFVVTSLPYNRYETSMNEFDWDMRNALVSFRSLPGKPGRFLSVHPDQDSLYFNGESASFNLRTNELSIGGVPHIISADAFIYPPDGKIQVLPGGVMSRLENAQIVADTLTQLHVINRATVNINGRKDFTASGYYEYNIGNREQEIKFSEIIGSRVGKGSRATKPVATRATGEVTERDQFYIDHKTKFRGTISLSSDTRNLKFDGFARLDANLPNPHWFSVSSEADKTDLALQFNQPRNFEGEVLHVGLFLSRETSRTYPRVLAPLYYRKDRPLLPVTGLLKYEQGRDRFVFGDSTKVMDAAYLRGNQLYFYNATGKIEAEGRFNLGEGLQAIQIHATGSAETLIEEIQYDSLAGGPVTLAGLKAQFMLGIDLHLPDDLMKLLVNDVKSSSFEASSMVYASDVGFYRRALANLFPYSEAEVRTAIDAVSLNAFNIPAKFNKFSLLFGKTPMKWDPDYQSFVTTSTQMNLISMGGVDIGRVLNGYMEIKMTPNDDDRFYLYLRSPSGFYYFFGYTQGIMNIVSNNTKFNDAVVNRKDKDRVVKLSDGKSYEIQPVNEGTADAFVRRIQAAN